MVQAGTHRERSICCLEAFTRSFDEEDFPRLRQVLRRTQKMDVCPIAGAHGQGRTVRTITRREKHSFVQNCAVAAFERRGRTFGNVLYTYAVAVGRCQGRRWWPAPAPPTRCEVCTAVHTLAAGPPEGNPSKAVGGTARTGDFDGRES